MDPKLQISILVFFSLAVLVGIFWIVKTEKRLKKFFLGKKANDLEDTILSMKEEISKLESAKEKNETEISELREKLKKSIRGLETVRFNPFPDQGGNQSFAVGMLNEDGDGVVISSLYGRERMSIFAKPVKKGKSDYKLTTEEEKALEGAKV